jgi:hypothetical protein
MKKQFTRQRTTSLHSDATSRRGKRGWGAVSRASVSIPHALLRGARSLRRPLATLGSGCAPQVIGNQRESKQVKASQSKSKQKNRRTRMDTEGHKSLQQRNRQRDVPRGTGSSQGGASTHCPPETRSNAPRRASAGLRPAAISLVKTLANSMAPLNHKLLRLTEPRSKATVKTRPVKGDSGLQLAVEVQATSS